MALRVDVREFPWIPRGRIKPECIDLKQNQKIKKKKRKSGGRKKTKTKLEKPCQNSPQKVSSNKAQHQRLYCLFT